MFTRTTFTLAQIWIAGAVVLAAAGCATRSGDELPKEVAYSAAGARDGLVIFGIDLNFNIGAGHEIRWQRIDETTKRYVPAEEQGVDVVMDLTEALWTKSTSLPRRHYVFRVRPGTYGLMHHVVREESVYRNKKTTVLHPPRTLVFTVKAGEILYIGDFHFLMVKCRFSMCSEKSRVVPGKPDLISATAALAKYPNVRGKPRYQRLETVVTR